VALAGRFASRAPDVLRALRRVDLELQRESAANNSPDSTIGSRRAGGEHVVSSDPRAHLQYADYVLEKLLGAGRMGRVYLARHKPTGREVAIKYLRKRFLRQPESVEQFVREAVTVSSFMHPGIVHIHGLGRTPGGGYFIAMDFVQGIDLAARIASGTVSVGDAVDWTIQACRAVH
jgi:serine/threonine protein kinase